MLEDAAFEPSEFHEFVEPTITFLFRAQVFIGATLSRVILRGESVRKCDRVCERNCEFVSESASE